MPGPFHEAHQVVERATAHLERIRRKPTADKFYEASVMIDQKFPKVVRVDALKTLLKLPSAKVVPFLLDSILVKEADSGFRMDIHEQLARAERPMHINALAKRFPTLRDEDRLAIAKFLGMYEVSKDHPVVAKALADPLESIRAYASPGFWESLIRQTKKK